jgi:hypothetical protein
MSPWSSVLHAHLIFLMLQTDRSSIVSTATGCGLDDREVRIRVPVGSRILTSPYHPDQLWAPPNPYPLGTRGKAAGA